MSKERTKLVANGGVYTINALTVAEHAVVVDVFNDLQDALRTAVLELEMRCPCKFDLIADIKIVEKED